MPNANQEDRKSGGMETVKNGPANDTGLAQGSLPAISLPKGGGAIRGIGEKFTANPTTGTGSLTVPIAVSPGRSGFVPQLSLSYDSGVGNGAFGLGWSLSLPTITRKTDKGLPQYHDTQESDVFILSGAEDLVPVLNKRRDRWIPDELERDGYQVKRYRPRIEGLFARIERWTRLSDGDIHWRSLSKDNILTVYGSDANSRICDPNNHGHIFSWLICRSYDDKGNAIVYEYSGEDDCNVDLGKINERNRVRTAQRYLKRIKYGNRKPLLLDTTLPGFRKPHTESPDFDSADWMFEVVFDYSDGHYREEQPDDRKRVFAFATITQDPKTRWPVRNDPFSSYRSGFEVRTYRLCRRILMFHHFPAELGTEDYLVRSTEFEYQEKTVGSFITEIIQSGYKRQSDERYLKKSLPQLELTYTSSPLGDASYHNYEAEEVDGRDLENLPGGIDGTNYRWLDLDGEGISGILTEQANAWFYKPNRGNGHFGALETVSLKPSIAELSRGHQQLMDVAGDGNLDLANFDSQGSGFFERTNDAGWRNFRLFSSMPGRDWNDPNIRFVDVTGDGLADVLITEDEALAWHPSLGKEGFGEAIRVRFAHDEEKGPRVVFADSTQSIYLADLSGDGLTDIARIRNGEVCYWPNLGYGRFGAKVTMDNSPWFDEPDLFDQRRVRLADTDGSGTTDILYLGRDGIRIFLNQVGNGWSNGRPLKQFPIIDNLTSISVVDFLGRGTACLVWSSPLPHDSRRPLRYLDLMAGQKPHLLARVRNNLGAETVIEYASSTEFYLADKAAGMPWITLLPFPVHVVKRVETYDRISRNRFVTRYEYHHGYFDGIEREFRGFGRVDQFDTEEFAALTQSGEFPVGNNVDATSHVPPVLTKTWFHTGAYLDGRSISKQFENEYYQEGDPRRGESKLEREQLKAMLLEDTILPKHLTPEEAREACRSLKGSMLREEVYALDGGKKSLRPYTVTETNYTINPLQPQGRNPYAVYFTHARESINLSYERKLYDIGGCKRADPRVTHNVTLEVDDYGNVTKSVALGYGRRFNDPAAILTDADHAKQRKPLITFTENRFTNAVSEGDAYRTPLLSESRTFELIKLQPDDKRSRVTKQFSFQELESGIEKASDGSHDLVNEDIWALAATANAPYRRLIKHTRGLYRSNQLDRLLPLGVLEALALSGETYNLTFTPGLLAKTYQRNDQNGAPQNLIPDGESILRYEGGYVDPDGTGYWWSPSGQTFYSRNHDDSPAQELADAQQHFFLLRRFCDPFGNVSTVDYDMHDLASAETRDALDNTVRAQTDYRVLSPRLITDQNGNRSEVAFDTLGMIVGTAIMGKEGENQGDTLQGFVADLDEETLRAHVQDPLRDPHELLKNASSRVVYDLFAFVRTQVSGEILPGAVYTLVRESHAADLGPEEQTKIQHAFTYSDGFGREIQKRVQAEPGSIATGELDGRPRWIATGWTISNNKGKPVRQYEPFFSDTHQFEFGRAIGVSSTLFYDPLGRVVATLHPNHTYEKVVFDPWRQETWDVNDTVLENPEIDADVRSFFKRLPQTDYLPTWYDQRCHSDLGPAEEVSAAKTAAHSGTPTVNYSDTFGRAFLMVTHNRFARNGATVEEHYATRFELDIDGNQRSVKDALNRPILIQDFDIPGNKIHQNSADAGERWMLNDLMRKPLRVWDSRDHQTRAEYDALRRPTNLFVRSGNRAERLAERIVYGEDHSNSLALNLRTTVFQKFDSAGVITNNEYDFKGNLLSATRELLVNYKGDADWSESPMLEQESFVSSTTFDALNRVLTLTAPDGSVIRPRYNEANLLQRMDVNLRGSDDVSSFVTNIDYNAKGQCELIEYGNGVHTRYKYDQTTFRLTAITTTRTSDEALLQSLNYSYDPIGNITAIGDAAPPTVYFKNQVVSANANYLYDAFYRLIGAVGREHIGQHTQPQSFNGDPQPRPQTLPTDGHAMRNYEESYEYDEVSNILAITHQAVEGNWKRAYVYDQGSLEPANNRLTSTTVGSSKESYSYDAHGNITSMPHLPIIEWDFKDQLSMTQRQVVNAGEAEKIYYVYDSTGHRVRKVRENSGGTKREERFYLGGFEVYRKYGQAGVIKFERETLHIMQDNRRIALVETKIIDDSMPSATSLRPLLRYQFSNHLDSTALELDDLGALISYEEYYPYGGTSHEAGRAAAEVSLKRYRYTGKERDEETGLYYYGARYYISWLGRWLNTDPAGLIDGTNVYTFSVCNPIRLTDPDGAATLAEEEAAQATLPELHGTALEEEQLVSLPEEHPEDEVCRMEEPPAPPAPAADPVPQEDPIGESGVRLRADAPREHYDNFVAQDMASHGYLNLAEIAEAGHGCAFCHIVKNYSTLREANASVDLAHYNMVSVFMANARDQLALTVATVPITAAMAPARLGTVAASSQTVIRTEAAVTTAAEGTAAAGDMVTIYRGTSHVAELETLADSGFVMSDAARTAFVEARYAGATVQEALQTANVASEAAHANQLRVWGSLADYTQAHGAFGTEISTFGPRSMISFTTNPGVAARFAGSTGTVLSATVPRSMLIPQTLAGATESEVLILHWLELGGL